jgi:hypothetical protein
VGVGHALSTTDEGATLVEFDEDDAYVRRYDLVVGGLAYDASKTFVGYDDDDDDDDDDDGHEVVRLGSG